MKVISDVGPFGVHQESFETYLLSVGVVDTVRNRTGEDCAHGADGHVEKAERRQRIILIIISL